MKKLWLKDEHGFTLVEILVSIVILAILAACFISLFTGSSSNIFTSGDRSQALYKAQESLEFVMSEGVSTPEATLSIQYDSTVGVNPIVVEGKLYEETITYNSKMLKLFAFILKR